MPTFTHRAIRGRNAVGSGLAYCCSSMVAEFDNPYRLIEVKACVQPDTFARDRCGVNCGMIDSIVSDEKVFLI